MTNEASRRYLIAYDITSDQRRLALSKKLESYGDRVQYSVFIVDGRPAKLIRLRRELQSIVVATEDSILICDLGRVDSIDTNRFGYIGLQRPLTSNDVISF